MISTSIGRLTLAAAFAGTTPAKYYFAGVVLEVRGGEYAIRFSLLNHHFWVIWLGEKND